MPNSNSQSRALQALVLSASSVQRRIVVTSLRAMGFGVTEVDSVKQAQHILRHNTESDTPFSLVVVHWEAVHGSTVPLLPWIRIESENRALPVLVVSERAHLEDVVFAQKAGADTYALTPLSQDVLQEKVNAILDGRPLQKASYPTGEHLAYAAQPIETASRDLEIRPAVLVVDDEEPARILMHYCLREYYEVIPAGTLAEALHAIVSRQLDAFLIDINLDGDSGLDLLAVLQAMPAYRNVPAIACTAFTMVGDRERLLDLGFAAYLSKPFRKQQLLDTLSSVLSAHSAAPGQPW